MQNISMRHALLVIPAMLLAACGGGGGGGSTAAPTNTGVASTLVISSGNAKPAAADGLDATTNSGSGSAGAGLVTGVQVTGASVEAAPVKLSSVAMVLASRAAQRSALATGVAVNESGACSLGGTIAITGEVSGGSALVAGDRLTITATNCTETVDNVASTISGILTLKVNSGSFSPDSLAFPKQISMTLTLNDLRVQSSGISNGSTGDMTIDLVQSAQAASRSTLSGTSIANTVSGSGVPRTTTLKNYKIVQEAVTTQTSINIVAASVITTNPKLGANVVYQLSTPTPIVTDLSVVAAGSVKITGLNSGLLLTTTSTPNNFTLQVDANGDGTYESSSTTTTVELRDLL